jgi:hypothetical protein
MKHTAFPQGIFSSDLQGQLYTPIVKQLLCVVCCAPSSLLAAVELCGWHMRATPSVLGVV